MKIPAHTDRHPFLIDRNSYEPAYLQLVNIIRRQIANGDFPPASRLPSESQFCEIYEVSPMTVRRAINMLVDQGVVTTAQGKGTFVRSLDISNSSFSLESLQNLLKHSTETSVELLGVNLVRADEQIGKSLSIPIGERVIYISRLIRREGHPVILHREYLLYDPRRPIVESEMEVTKLMGLLEGQGQSAFKKGQFFIEAVMLNETDAKLLGADVSSPAFRLEHTFYDFADMTVSWGWFLAKADRLRFTARVGIWD
jgi:DNA-binding GntR family transcriptional regulator